MRRRLAVAAIAFAGALLAMLGAPAPASAHAYLAASTPADGAVLDNSPEKLTLQFTEHIEPSATRIEIVDGDGRHWALTSIAVRTAATAGLAATDNTEAPMEVLAGLPALPANTYRVVWSTLSSDDLHVTSGSIVFGVHRQVVAAASAPIPAGPGVREPVVRALMLLGLALLFGGAVTSVLTTDGDLRRRLLLISSAGGAAALILSPFLLFIQVNAGGQAALRLLAQQLGSGRWLLAETGTALLTAIVSAARRDRFAARTRVGAAAGCAAAAIAATGFALLGHPLGATVITALLGGAHLIAAGGWAGGVLALAAAGRPRAILAVFFRLAVPCVTVLAVTGLIMAGIHISTVDALLRSPYGLILLVKVTAMAAAGLIGLRTSLRLHGGRTAERRVVLAEAGILAGVLALAGTLAAAGPARGPAFPAGPAAAETPQVSGGAADLEDALTIKPNRPGRNIVAITISNTRRPAPGPVTGVSIQLTSPDGTRFVHPVARATDGWAATLDDIRTPGQWKVSVTIMRDGLPPATAVHDWTVAGGATAPVRYSARRIQPWTTAGAILAGLVGILAVVLYARRRRVAPPTEPDLAIQASPSPDLVEAGRE